MLTPGAPKIPERESLAALFVVDNGRIQPAKFLRVLPPSSRLDFWFFAMFHNALGRVSAGQSIGVCPRSLAAVIPHPYRSRSLRKAALWGSATW